MDKKPDASKPLFAVKVNSAKLKSTERLSAELLPYEVVDIYAKETGFLKAIRVDRGSKVKQGELIAVIEAPELVAHASTGERFLSERRISACGRAGQAFRGSSDVRTHGIRRQSARWGGSKRSGNLRKTAESDEANVTALQRQQMPLKRTSKQSRNLNRI